MNLNTHKKRFFEYGFMPSIFRRGEQNAITDVSGVLVGHTTCIEGDLIRTGVTVIDPGVPTLFRNKIPSAVYVGNGFGKLVGSTQIDELGTLETPIALTNTLAVGPVMRAVVDLVIRETPDLRPTETINAVVGETNDGFLNDIHKNIISSTDVMAAYNNRSSTVAIGNVGAGTGTRAFAWKGGMGSASRIIPIGPASYTVATLVQTNFGGALTIAGVPVGEILGKTDFTGFERDVPDGSCMIVLATDAPLTALQLKRIAKRAVMGLVRTGSILAHGSGDYAIAFTTNRATDVISDEQLNPFFLASMDAVEESVYDALFAADSMTGRDGNVLPALPVEEVLKLLNPL